MGLPVSDESVCKEKWALSQAVSRRSVGAVSITGELLYVCNVFQELFDKKKYSWCETNK